MPRVTPVRWQDLVRVFEHVGYHVGRIRGDHMALLKPGALRPIVIPRHREIGVGLIEATLRTAGMTREQYLYLAHGGPG
jgi:predicted RNA binding protein YcfA (HicA-like mRNA interferase family)